MSFNKKKIIKIVAIVAIAGILIGLGVVYYMFNMPHRNAQSEKTDFSVNASQLVNEYLTDAAGANEKYLSADGNSKILEVTGTVALITEDFSGRRVVLLKEESEKVGVNCAFLPESGENAAKLVIGQKASIKGVIRSGANYDPDFDLYENVVMEQCDVVGR